MGLSEFISKNKEFPDPKIEWEQSELLVKTLAESGVAPLLEQLRDSILSNPTLDHSWVRLEKKLFVHGIPSAAKTARNRVGPDFLFYGIEGFRTTPADKYYLGNDKVPCARIELYYNENDHWYPLGGGYFNSPTSFERLTTCRVLSVGCDEPGRLKLWAGLGTGLWGGRPALTPNEVNMEEQQWRQSGAVDDALGKLYSKAPARKRIEK